MDIKVTDLKKYLSTKTDKELREEIIELFKSNDKVKEYYFLKVKPGEEEILMNKYKVIIQNQFFPKRGVGQLRYSVLRKAISDFKKISRNPQYLTELMMTYVENGVEFTCTYGDIDETFYSNIASMYQIQLIICLRITWKAFCHCRLPAFRYPQCLNTRKKKLAVMTLAPAAAVRNINAAAF